MYTLFCALELKQEVASRYCYVFTLVMRSLSRYQETDNDYAAHHMVETRVRCPPVLLVRGYEI